MDGTPGLSAVWFVDGLWITRPPAFVCVYVLGAAPIVCRCVCRRGPLSHFFGCVSAILSLAARCVFVMSGMCNNVELDRGSSSKTLRGSSRYREQRRTNGAELGFSFFVYPTVSEQQLISSHFLLINSLCVMNPLLIKKTLHWWPAPDGRYATDPY